MLIVNIPVENSQTMYFSSTKTSHLAVQYAVVDTAVLLNFLLVEFRHSQHFLRVREILWFGFLKKNDLYFRYIVIINFKQYHNLY